MGIWKRTEPLRVGFLPVSDCAPLVYAYEAGLFAKYELEVHLQRESSWANVRDKVICGDLDAAQAPATLPFLSNIGVGTDPCTCVTGLVLSLQGNAITLSRPLWDQGVHDAATLREQIFKTWGKRTYTFAVASSFSVQEVLLRRWLQAAGIDPETAVRMVVAPPAQLFPMLKLGYIDGYCADEPWGSVAEQAEAGVCVATSAELAPLHPEKVLMVRQSFAIGRADEHERLLAALLEACAFCDEPRNRLMLSEMLAHPRYVNAPLECIKAGLVGPFESSGHPAQSLLDLTLFHRHNANDPTDAKARWIMDHLDELLQLRVLKRPNLRWAPVLKNVFRRDLFERAKAVLVEEVQRLEVAARRYRAGSGER